ncbi:MAG: tetratricopeptide repeat protein [Bryobacterales bacterium]|nr:tetratricopeptide repeat protein [Bryobacterales bacterium]
MKNLWMMLTLAAAAAFYPGVQAQTAGGAEVLLEAAKNKELLSGDLEGAIRQYKEILAKHPRNRAAAATALVRMGQCYEKLGDAEARKAFENVVRNYSDQKDMVAQARSRLAAMGAGSRTSLSTRQLIVNADQACYGWNVSQDGRLLGAVEYKTGNMAVIDAVTGECRALTAWGAWNNKNGFVDQGAISRDGRWLASWHYGAANDGEIRVVGTDGKRERTVYVRQREWAIPTDWSPDGKSILVLFEHGKQGSNQSGTAEIAAVASSGGALKVLKTYEYEVRHRPKILYSPDGNYIAWDHPVRPGSGDTDLVIMPAAGGPEARIAENPGSDKLVGWTAAGHLVFLSDRTGRLGLYIVRMSGGKQLGEPQELRANLPAIEPVGLSANGTFFYSESISRSDAVAAQLDIASGKLSSEPRPLVPLHPKSTASAAWSPDGHWFAVRRLTDDRNRTTFLIQPVSGGDARELTVPLRMLDRTRLVWSPDGRFLHTAGFSAKGFGVFRIDAKSGEIQVLGTDRDLTEWNADGRFLFRRGGPQGSHILLTDTHTGQTRAVFEGTKQTRSFAVSPDGKRLAFVGSGYTDSEPSPLMILDLESGVTRQVDSAWFSHSSSHFTWMPDGNHLLVLRQPKPHWATVNLAVIPLNGEPARPLAFKFPARTNVDGLAIHPDGKTVTWTLITREQMWWAMDNFLPSVVAQKKR